MDNDYLWDGSGTPDPDVERLERLLGRLRAVPPPLRLPEPASRRRWPSYVPLLATAAVVVVMVGMTWRTSRRPVTSWRVASTAGPARLGASTFGAAGRLAVGQTLTTDAASRAWLEVGTIGQVTVESDTTLRLVATGTAHHRLALDRGTINAFIQ